MVKVNFKFEKERDYFNIWETCNVSSKWFDHKKFVSPSLLQICENNKFETCKEGLDSQRKKMYDSGFIKIYTDALQKAWNKINDPFFEKLSKIMKKQFVMMNSPAISPLSRGLLMT